MVILLNVVEAVGEVMKVLLAAPVNMVFTLLLANAVKLIVPLFIRSPPMEMLCVLSEAGFTLLESMEAPVEIVTVPETVNETFALVLKTNVPLVPPPTVSELQEVVISAVTVEPSAIITSSPAAGATPPTHVVVALQLPPVAVEVMVPAKEKATSKDVKSNK